MATDFNEGDMVLALVDYWMHHMSVPEMQDLARKQLTRDATELTSAEVRKLYGALTGEESHESDN